MSNLKSQVDDAKTVADHACDVNKQLQADLEQANARIEQLESQSRRDNLIFHGIEGDDKETWDESEDKVRSFLSDKLDIDGDEVEFERVHRLKSRGGNTAPIIAKFTKYKQRSAVLDAAQTKLKKKDTYGVSQDFTKKVRDTRKTLIPFMTEARNQNKRAYLSYDKLVIDKVKYVFDEGTEDIVPV
ncbi:uncharacterized protein [Amphiura filiformis]|uniref:uncharacterized protein n=1 Tax=Amphiura filiformis TaxID=82378 RepID=UPI003B216102